MHPALIILLCVLGIVILLLLIAVIHTLTLGTKATSLEYTDDKERLDLYANKLSTMIQYETISHREDPEVEKFRGFHKVLKELFPNVFAKLTPIEMNGNLILHWKGKRSDIDPIFIMSHQDVVPAEGEWKYPPFSGTIAEGKVWGRGSGDTKCSVMAFYQAVEELLANDYTPECDVYIGGSCTEEIGGNGAPTICKYFKDNGIHLFMICDEGGGIVSDPISGVKGNFAAIGIFEKGYGDLKFTARSNGGHASAPPKNSPIPRLAAFVNSVEKKSPFKAKFSPAVTGMLSSLAPYCESFGLKLVISNLWLFKPLLKKVLPSVSAQAAAMLKTTIGFTKMEGSKGYNVLPQEASIGANLRFIPHQPMEESIEAISARAAKYGLETEIITAGDPSKSLDLNGKPFAITSEAVKRVFPGIGIMPYVVTGATDCRFYQDVCDSCVRFSPINYDPAQLSSMHGLNENIDVGTLPGAVDYYKTIIQAQEHR